MLDFVPEELKVKKEKSTEEKVSPYRAFTDWILNPRQDIELDEKIIKAINPRTVLCMFGGFPNITIFLNKHFNNFGVMYLDNKALYTFLKLMILRFKITKYEFSFFASEKNDKSLSDIQRILPYLKKYEIYDLIERSKDDEDYDSFCETLGLKGVKRTKVKKVKKVVTESLESLFTETNVNLDEIKTFEDWKKCFT